MQEMLSKWIDDTQEKIFAYQFNEAGQELLTGIELLSQTAALLPQERINEFNDIISGAMGALQKSDYLLLADFLQFKFKPFLESYAAGGRR